MRGESTLHTWWEQLDRCLKRLGILLGTGNQHSLHHIRNCGLRDSGVHAVVYIESNIADRCGHFEVSAAGTKQNQRPETALHAGGCCRRFIPQVPLLQPKLY